MQYIAGFVIIVAIIGVIAYLLIIGGILIWPIFNILAYLKVLIFPSAVRKKYGSNLAGQNSSFFDQAITTEDNNEIIKLGSVINSLKNSLSSEINSLESSNSSKIYIDNSVINGEKKIKGKTVFINKDKKKDENYKILHPMYEQITL